VLESDVSMAGGVGFHSSNPEMTPHVTPETREQPDAEMMK
jgi:hypothetical protein